MEVIRIHGYELEKSFPTTSEDFFNRSEVTLLIDREEHTFSVLYVRTFLEKLWELVPYEQNPIFELNGQQYQLEDIVALIVLIKNSDMANRKRLYINDFDEFANYFKDFQFSKLKDVFVGLAAKEKFYIKRPLDFLL